MAASTAAFTAVGSVVLPSGILSSSNSYSTSLKGVPVPAAARGQRAVAGARASLPEQEQRVVTRRDVLANVLGAGAALGFVGQALAANPGTLPRSLNVKKKEEKAEGKKE